MIAPKPAGEKQRLALQKAIEYLNFTLSWLWLYTGCNPEHRIAGTCPSNITL
jgi:hypothetical protein